MYCICQTINNSDARLSYGFLQQALAIMVVVTQQSKLNDNNNKINIIIIGGGGGISRLV